MWSWSALSLNLLRTRNTDQSDVSLHIENFIPGDLHTLADGALHWAKR